MSQWIMTHASRKKLKLFSFAFTLTFVTLFTINKLAPSHILQAQLQSSCLVVESNLPMNHIKHPCYTSNMANQSSKSWLSWLSGDSKSTHLHFLDLVELIHYSFH